jgi:fructose-1,6-bisphosphatase-3
MPSLSAERLKYLNLLSEQFPSIRAVSTEIINLQARLNLPKGTEHFISDIHGEYEPFSHVMRNASGVIKDYIVELFGNSMLESEMKSLATLVYYPQEKLAIARKTENGLADWYKITIFRLIRLCKRASSKYTRARVRRTIDTRFAYILEELLHEDVQDQSKQDYYNQIVDTIVRIGSAEDYIIELCTAIQKLAIYKLHIIGDIFDRGPHADKILDALSRHHSVDIQWGNHDIVWMGAAAGSAACILNVIRVSARYANLHTLEDGYGINLVPLVTYAIEYYGGGSLDGFMPETLGGVVSEKEAQLTAQIHKAATILQFKAEAEIIRRHPEYNMSDRLLLDKIELNKADFPTVNPQDPFSITAEEADIIEKLAASFMHSPRLQRHAEFLFSKGGMYKALNGNLMFHGCVPMNADGTLKDVRVGDGAYRGKMLLDVIERRVREGFLNHSDPTARADGQDTLWYLWCGADSPLFGSNRMATFERYFFADKSTHTEERDPYYTYRDTEETCKMILADFGLDPETAHIINGHVPVKVMKGESPVKANGKLLVIDGGFAKAYQKSTGIAGYTLIYNSHGLLLVSHEPFVSAQKAIEDEMDIHSSSFVVEYANERIKVRDTDDGAVIFGHISDLTDLLRAYETGEIKENQ